MNLIPALLIVGMLAVSGWAEGTKPEPYSPELVKKAEAGDAKAQFSLGFCYMNGEGVNEDAMEAMKWYTKAAEQGNADAQLFLGYIYHLGMGVTKDDREAVKWWKKSAMQGNEIAKKELQSKW